MIDHTIVESTPVLPTLKAHRAIDPIEGYDLTLADKLDRTRSGKLNLSAVGAMLASNKYKQSFKVMLLAAVAVRLARQGNALPFEFGLDIELGYPNFSVEYLEACMYERYIADKKEWNYED